jgi:hypothetical protein
MKKLTLAFILIFVLGLIILINPRTYIAEEKDPVIIENTIKVGV